MYMTNYTYNANNNASLTSLHSPFSSLSTPLMSNGHTAYSYTECIIKLSDLYSDLVRSAEIDQAEAIKVFELAIVYAEICG